MISVLFRTTDSLDLDGSGENLSLTEPDAMTIDPFPYIIRVLFKKMTYDTYQDKLKDPEWLYKLIHLCDDCYSFIKDISDLMTIK